MESQNQSAWSFQAIGFRFLFAYFLFYMLPFPFTSLPFVGGFFSVVSDAIFQFTDMIYRSAVVSDPLVMPNGSGDTTYNYIQIYVFGILALFTALVWTVVQSTRRHDEKLYRALFILVRYYVAVFMIGYGLAKIFKTQFPFPHTYDLSQTYGDSSPMRLLWTFMGYSVAYNLFAGLGEFVGGFLLFFRRTRLLGAMVVIGVMTHVVVLNFSYDIPVKLFSSHLLLMAIFLAWPDWKRLANVFVLNRDAKAELLTTDKQHRRTGWYYYFGKGVLLAWFIIPATVLQVNTRHSMEDDIQKNVATTHALLGEYDVTTFILAGDTISRGIRGVFRWEKVTFGPRQAKIVFSDYSDMAWICNSNTGYNRFMVVSPDLGTILNFTYESADDMIIATGIVSNKQLVMTMKKIGEGKSLLVNRGFHWVNEYPYYY